MKAKKCYKDSIFDIRAHFKPTETFQYTHFSFCHALVVKKGFIKGEANTLLGTNSSKTTFEESIKILDHTCVSEAIQIIW